MKILLYWSACLLTSTFASDFNVCKSTISSTGTNSNAGKKTAKDSSFCIDELTEANHNEGEKGRKGDKGEIGNIGIKGKKGEPGKVNETEIKKLQEDVKELEKLTLTIQQLKKNTSQVILQMQTYKVCSSKPCVHGNCSFLNNTHFCACKDGYAGRNCSTNILTANNKCNTRRCVNGICANGTTTHACACFVGPVKANCSSSDLRFCSAGMRAGDARVNDSSITASASYQNYYPREGRLNFVGGHGGWGAANTNPGSWLQVYLTNFTRVTGVVTQSNGNNDYRVTKYKISYSNTTRNFQIVKFPNGTEITFLGNSVRNTPFVNVFPQPITAKYFRLIAQGYFVWPSLRMDYLVC